MGKYSISQLGSYTRFHKGYLATCDEDERADLCRREWGYLDRSPVQHLENAAMVKEGYLHEAIRHYATRSLGIETDAAANSDLTTCLSNARCTSLNTIVREANITPPQRRVKANLVTAIANELPRCQDLAQSLLDRAEPDTFELFVRIARGEVVQLTSQLASKCVKNDMFPFVFESRGGKPPTLFMPQELQPLFEQINLAPIMRKRACLKAALSLTRGFVLVCGVVPLRHLHEQFVRRNPQYTCTLDQFVRFLEEAHNPAPLYRIQRHNNIDYVVYSPERNSWYHFEQDRKTKPLPRHERAVDIDTLLSSQSGIACRMDTTGADCDEIAHHIYSLPCVKQLIRYFDSHIPDDEDDFVFAEEMVDAIIGSFAFDGAGIESVLTTLTEQGWYMAEGGNTAPQLTRLVIELFRSLPRWELNGWSEYEYLDLTSLPLLISEGHLAQQSLPKAS